MPNTSANRIAQLTDAALEQLRANLAAGRSDTLKAYLATMAKFHRYSFGNQMLIAFQRPDATHVAGFHTWKKLGRYVRRGERGIVIIAPCVTSRGNRKVGEAVQTDAQGNERREDVRNVVGFRGAYVWDVTATDGQPLPEFARVCGESIVVEERMVLRVPASLELSAVAPLLCAGITTYSPLKRANLRPGTKVGVVGLGGLGHMGVKFAKAMGAHVTVFTTSPRKKDDARRLGADAVVVSKNKDEMDAAARSLDYILDCVAVDHDLAAYLATLKHDGELCLVGAPEKPLTIDAFALIMGRVKLSGSPIGGIKETQEMLDFCGQHNITADVELIPIQDVNKAYERLEKGDVKYRFSIDMASLKQE